MARSNSILVLGASGWLGHYLVPQLIKLDPLRKIIAGYHERRPSFPLPSDQIVRISAKAQDQLSEIDASTVINLARGEDEAGFHLHQSIIRNVNSREGRYLYASSSNAVDSDVSKAHSESEAASAQTEYGKFKARCEQELFATCPHGLAFRFSAAHGWAPNRTARTEEFLKKLKDGQFVPVNLGVVQNRLFIGDLAGLIARLALTEDARGVWHLGATDSSEEIDFLRLLATAFGYAPEQVREDKRINWNLAMTMGKFSARFPEIPLPSESQTIAKVAAQPELAKYRKRSKPA